MSASWREDDEEYRVGGAKGAGLKSKPRFSFHEIKVLLEAVKRNRYVLLRKFNQGVSADTKKQTWIEITNQINALGENHREVRQIMKKWADLKCDGKRRMVALRGVNGHPTKKKNMGPVERMVHKILIMSPKGNGDSDFDLCEDEDFTKVYSDAPMGNPSPYSYLNVTESSLSVPDRYSFDMSPLSSPENDASGDPFHSSSEFDLDLAEDGEQSMDYDDNDEALFSSYPSSLHPPPSTSQEQDPLPDSAPLKRPVHTYSRGSSHNNHVQNNTSSKAAPEASTSSAPPPDPDAAEAQPTTSSKTSSSFVPPLPPASSSSSSVTANDATSKPASSSSKPPPSSSPSPSSSSTSTPRPSKSSTFDPLPAGASSRRAQEHVAAMASQSVEQQRASRMLLTSVSQSLEVLAQSVQLLVESQQEFVQESLMLQRETVDVLRDFSNTALTMLRDKANSGQAQARHHHHPASHF